LISLYAKALFNSVKTAMGFAAALGALYGYIYIIIQSEDYALLFGSIGLFCIMAVIMYYSRKIEWYAAPEPDDPVPSTTDAIDTSSGTENILPTA
jgi:inner membrane protein